MGSGRIHSVYLSDMLTTDHYTRRYNLACHVLLLGRDVLLRCKITVLFNIHFEDIHRIEVGLQRATFMCCWYPVYTIQVQLYRTVERYSLKEVDPSMKK